MFAEQFANVRTKSPLIHNITNYVTVNDCANMVLACGASPIMADDAAEVEDITTICGGLNINIGTLNSRTIESMLKAGKKANALGHPVVLDHTFCAAAENTCKFKGNLSCASGQFKAAGVFWHRSENHECERRPFMKPVIETHALCKSYHGRPVVDHLNLTVPEGCVYGFLGPNGAGKSTTMKMLLGLVHPTGGSVELLGHTMNETNRIPLLRQTGSLIESPSGYLHLTARENLSIVADLKDVDRKDISRVLEIVHLTKDADRKVGQYSLGMKQRLGIAMALRNVMPVLAALMVTVAFFAVGVFVFWPVLLVAPGLASYCNAFLFNRIFDKYGMTLE